MQTRSQSASHAPHRAEFVPLLASEDPRYRATWRAALTLMVSLPIVILLFALHFIIGPLWEDETWKKIAEAIATSFGDSADWDSWMNLLLFVVAFPLVVVISKVGKRSRLFIGPQHIAITGSPIDKLFGQEFNWSIKTSDITDAWVEKQGSAAAFLVLKAHNRHRINLLHWVPRDFRWPQKRGIRRLEWTLLPPWRNDFEASPIVAKLNEVGVTVDPFPKRPGFRRDQFDLMSQRRSLVLTLLIGGLLAYGCLDLMFGSERYAAERPFLGIAAVAAFFAVIGWLIANDESIPTSIAMTLAVLLGLSGGFAAYPGTLRVNALLDPNGIQQVSYVRLDGATFAAREDNWPDLEFPDPPYWVQLEGTPERSIAIRRGGLGIVQVDFSSLYPEIHEYYR